MNANVSQLGAVPKIDHAERITAGLEQIAGEIRRSECAFDPLRCVSIVYGRAVQWADDFAIAFFGSDAGTAEVVGMLELAKLQAAEADG
ncbi:MAG TPA: hypothetical protein VEY92_12615 [Pseudoxanthomonas sp.]|nr:hypothetical protein [Pseudoxanthomonas sp.]